MRIPGVLRLGSQFSSVIRTMLTQDNVNDERETQATFEFYNNASSGKTNKDETIIFWITDWIDPPNFKSKIEREYCNF